MKKKGKNTPSIKTDDFQCSFCSKKFKREATILSHKCNIRDRYNLKDTRTSREAFRIWELFYKHYNLSVKRGVEPFMYFVKSSTYNDFYSLATYLEEYPIVDQNKFIDDIILGGVPSHLWRTPEVYKDWVLKYTQNEHPRRGIERSILAIHEWSVITGYEWNHFFEDCTTDRAMMFIETGKVSPWLIYIASKDECDKLLGRFSEYESVYLSDYLDPYIWKSKVLKYRDEVTDLRNLLKEYGL